MTVNSCDGCGACCLEQESPPAYIAIISGVFGDDIPADDPDLRRVNSLPEDVKAELLEYIERLRDGKPHPNDGVCLWFDEESRQCKHYDLRPSICRDGVQVGDKACLAWRKTYRIGASR